jgi:hypothetical protein
MPLRPRRQRLLGGIVAVLLVAGLAMGLALQGWRSRIVNVDIVPHIEGAQAFVVHGSVPDRGCLSGFASYIPPGVTWLFLPGVLLFDDPRLLEAAGSGLLFVGTLLGILLLAHDVWGIRCALLAVGLYGLSELGLIFAGSLWPRGHPFFYVWMIVWTERWVHHRQARYLAAALVTWAVGMYVFLELGPAVLVLVVVWFWHRPPLRLSALVVAATVIMIVWSPYLAFEAERDFVDLRSQILHQQMLPAHFQQSWCDPTLTKLREWGEPDDTQEKPASLGSRLLLRGKALLWGLPYNFERVALVPGASLLLLAMSSLTILQGRPLSVARRSRVRCLRLRPLALLLMLGAVVANALFLAPILLEDFVLSASTGAALRVWHVALGLSGLALFLGSWNPRPSGDVPLCGAGGVVEDDPSAERARVLNVGLLVPWCLLLLLAEADPYPLGGERRFWWLWPLQVITLAASVTHVLPRWGVSRRVVSALQVGLVLTVLLNPLTYSRTRDWLRTGWSGSEAPEIQTVDFVAEQLRRRGKTQAAIGYQTLYMELPAFNFFMADFNIVDARYKVGAEFDFLFAFRHRIVNTSRCAEGFSPHDEYRVVQSSAVWDAPKYAGLVRDGRLQMLGQFGPYRVFKRD